MNKEILKTLNKSELEAFFQRAGESCALFSPSKEKENGFPFEPISGGKTIFYPGSFSPWHKGHKACLLGLPQCPEGEVWDVVVAPDYNPWKQIRETDLKEEVLNLWDSLEELKEIREDLHFHLYLGFLGEKKKNPTYKWMENTRAKGRWLLMGEDSFLDLDQWFEAEKLLNLLEGIIVVPREAPVERVLEQKEKVLSLAANLQVTFLEHHKYEHFSSTYLRENK